MKRGKIPDAPMRMVIRNRLEYYTVYRRASGKDSLGQSNDQYTESHDERLFVYRPNNSTTQTDFGERVEGDLNGIGLPSANIGKDDRIEYNGERYEVDSSPEKRGNESMNDFITFSLSKIQD